MNIEFTYTPTPLEIYLEDHLKSAIERCCMRMVGKVARLENMKSVLCSDPDIKYFQEALLKHRMLNTKIGVTLDNEKRST